jgi:hypothetical protein
LRIGKEIRIDAVFHNDYWLVWYAGVAVLKTRDVLNPGC